MSAAPVDIPGLRDLMAGYDGLLGNLLRMFLSQAPSWQRELQEAFLSGEAERLRRVCHKIKGSAATLQAQGIIAAAVALGGHAAQHGLAGADDHYRRLLAAIDDTVAFVHHSGHLDQ